MKRIPAVLILIASALGLLFSSLSTFDYVEHLDRQLHAVHCTLTPGLAAAEQAENACRVAMYSPYSALFRGRWWGGIPISLFAIGIYAFFFAFAVSMLVRAHATSRKAYQFVGAAAVMPAFVSVVMALIAAIKLGVFCKTCAGLYIASLLLAIGGLWGLRNLKHFRAHNAFASASTAQGPTGTNPQGPGLIEPVGMPLGHRSLPLLWSTLLALSAVLPAFAYVASVPDVSAKLTGCGKLAHPTSAALLPIGTVNPKRATLLVTDPLCPSCRGLHQRLIAEGAWDNMKVKLSLMPLDSECNWMLDRSLHPGSCLLSKALICSEPHVGDALGWMFDNQQQLAAAGKSDVKMLRQRVIEHFGQSMAACLKSKKTKTRLNEMLQFAVRNQMQVSTPQLYLGSMRVCDEDTDLGLRYTLGHLAPELFP